MTSVFHFFLEADSHLRLLVYFSFNSTEGLSRCSFEYIRQARGKLFCCRCWAPIERKISVSKTGVECFKL
ncbi:MAG: hypothetical protein COT74_13225 [Bdellovibrionales bacterium CG10_big_fil_rev_8_21_14_0_10_45_34]|nr:MAG: hypothetical protein COT74_13225 [Bdellovibrionales bacterium CG10_big_fil_rev_8_21_14_0_10_45_34]